MSLRIRCLIVMAVGVAAIVAGVSKFSNLIYILAPGGVVIAALGFIAFLLNGKGITRRKAPEGNSKPPPAGE